MKRSKSSKTAKKISETASVPKERYPFPDIRNQPKEVPRMTTHTAPTTTRSPRLLAAMERVANLAAHHGKSEAREEAAQLKAVKVGFDAYLARAPLADRHALLDTLAKMVGERSADRIRAYAARMTEWTQPAKPAASAPVEVSAKATKGDVKGA
jgi:hypothetical protein